MWKSVPHSPTAVTRTSTSPGPGSTHGTSRSSIRPMSTRTAAFKAGRGRSFRAPAPTLSCSAPPPVAHLVQPPHDRPGDQAFGGRPHVEEEVAALGCHVDQRPQQRARVFPVVVVRLVAPGVVHRHARLPIDAGQSLGRNLLLRGPEVPEPDLTLRVESAQSLASVTDTVVDDQAGTDGADEVVQIPPPLVAPVHDPFAVAPQHVDGGVL